MALFNFFKKSKNYDTHEEKTSISDEVEEPKSMNEILDKISQKYNDIYFMDCFIRRLEKYPDLVNKLLIEEISSNSLFELNQDISTFLPLDENDLWLINYLDFDEETQKKVDILNSNLVSEQDINNDDYITIMTDNSFDFETCNYENKIDTFFDSIQLTIDSSLLTKIESFSSIIVHLPKNKYKKVYHSFHEYIEGKIELDSNVIIEIPYFTYQYLDSNVIDKISNCKILFNDSFKDHEDNFIQDNNYNQDTNDYTLIKYQHLLYVVENSSLEQEIKDKLIYEIKNFYYDNPDIWSFNYPSKIISYIIEKIPDEIENLTRKMEENIELYKNKSIEKPEFNANYYISSKIPNFESMDIEQLIEEIKYLPDTTLKVLLKEPRVMKKLSITENIDENQLLNLIFLIKQSLSYTTMSYVKSLNFNYEEFMQNPTNCYQSSQNINKIVSQYGVFDSIDERTNICVANLVGHDHFKKLSGKNILYTIEKFYDYNGDGYHSRANALLKYKSGEELLKAFEERNSDTKDMVVSEIEDGKFIITNNGLHRFTLLRFHYLLDLMKQNKDVEELNKLYTIPVTLHGKVNHMHTYCNYLICKANEDINFISFTSNEITIYYHEANKTEKITEEELLKRAIVSVEVLDSSLIDEFYMNYVTYESFKTFVDTYLPNLMLKFKEGEKTEHAKDL